MARDFRRFIPALEAFDDRVLPTVTFAEVLDPASSTYTLRIVGDEGPNQISISDDGTGFAGAVVVQGDGQLYFSENPISNIEVVTAGGVDTVDYWLVADLSFSRTVTVDLGAKIDTFTAHLNDRTINADTKLAISAFGQGGNDHFNLDAQNVTVGARAELAIDFQGGHGREFFNLNDTVSVDPDGGKFSLTTSR
jgi:hypothetical protein